MINLPFFYIERLPSKGVDFIDSPNHSLFPSTLLKRGANFPSTTIYQFSVAE